MRKFLLINFILMLFISISMYAENNTHAHKIVYAKNYISLDQLQIDSKGMAIAVNDKIVPIKTLGKDNKGYYVLCEYTYCPYCGMKCYDKVVPSVKTKNRII